MAGSINHVIHHCRSNQALVDKTAKNDITGDSIITKPASQLYAENYDLIFKGYKFTNEQIEAANNVNSELQQSIESNS